MNLIHVCLNVADAAEAEAFYGQFGFERSWSFTTGDGETENVYLADEAGVELQLADTEGETDFEGGTAWDHLAVGVDDVDAVFEDVDHYGVVTPPTTVPEAGARVAFVEDPDGHVVELVEGLE